MGENAKPFRRSVAVVVGIDDYANGIPCLRTAVRDAQRIAEVLTDQHGFRVVTLDGCTTSLRLRRLVQRLAGVLTADDRFLIYFAGHGLAARGDDGPAGYLLLADARRQQPDSFLPMRELHAMLTPIPCRHGLVILDCCFAGAMRWSSTRAIELLPDTLYAEQFEAYLRGDAWQLIVSSADDEYAIDTLLDRDDGTEHSPFAAALIDGLLGAADRLSWARRADAVGDGVMTVGELQEFLFDRVIQATRARRIQQTPSLWPLPRHGKGQYFFLTPDASPTLPRAAELIPVNNPYRGLYPFDVSSRDLYFGRDAAIAQLSARVQEHPFVAVVGASGSGKSSLVNAGLVTALHDKGWRIVGPVRAGPDPVTALASLQPPQASSDGGESLPAIAATASPARLLPILALLLEDSAERASTMPTLLILDQLEEIVTLGMPPLTRAEFLEALAGAVAKYAGLLHIVVTARAEFEPSLSAGVLRPWWVAGRFSVPAMTRAELRAAIEGPALKRALFFDPPSLVDELLDGAHQMPGSLPLLAFTMSELYIACVRALRTRRTLTKADFDRIGGVIGSIQERATQEYERSSPQMRDTLRRLFLRMVSVDGGVLTRRRVLLDELDVDDEAENDRRKTLVARLVDARLLVSDVDASGAPYIEPAHDVLVIGWSRVVDWKNEARPDLGLQRRLTTAAQEWKAAGKDKGLLWLDHPRLPELKEWVRREPHGRSRIEEVFVVATIAAHSRRWWQRVGTAVAAFVILAAVAVALWVFQQRASTARVRAIAQSLAAQGIVQHVQAREDERGALLLRQGYRFYARYGDAGSSLTQVDAGLRQSLAMPYFRAALDLGIGAGSAVAFDAPAHTLAVGTDHGLVYLFDVRRPHPLPVLLEPQNAASQHASIRALTFEPDSQHILAVSEDGTLRRYNRAQPGARITLFTADSALQALAFDATNGRVAIGDAKGRLWIASLDDWRSKRSIPSAVESSAAIRGLALSGDGQRLASAHDGGIVNLWHLVGGVFTPVTLPGRATLPDAETVVAVDMRAVAFSPDGLTLAAGADDSRIWLWDTRDPRKPPRHLTGHQTAVFSLAFDATRKLLVSASDDNRLGIWRYELADSVPAFHDSTCGQIVSVAIAQAGDLMASGCRGTSRVMLWDLDRYILKTARLRVVQSSVSTIAFSGNGRLMVVGDAQGRLAALTPDGDVWRPQPPQLIGDQGKFDSVFATLSEDGHVLAACSGTHVHVWASWPSSPTSLPVRSGPGRCVTTTLNSAGDRLILGNSDGIFARRRIGATSVAAVPTASALDDLHHSEMSIEGAAFLADGRHFVAIDQAGRLKRWDFDAPDGDPKELGELSSTVAAFGISGDRQTLAVASDTGEVVCWRGLGAAEWTSGWFERARITLPQQTNVEAIALSDDGRRLAILLEQDLVRVYAVEAPTLGPVELRVPRNYKDAALTLAFEPHSLRLVTGSWAGWLQFTSLDTKALADVVCQKVWRNLTLAEWEEFIGRDIPYERTCEALPPGVGAPGADDRPLLWKLF